MQNRSIFTLFSFISSLSISHFETVSYCCFLLIIYLFFIYFDDFLYNGHCIFFFGFFELYFSFILYITESCELDCDDCLFLFLVYSILPIYFLFSTVAISMIYQVQSLPTSLLYLSLPFRHQDLQECDTFWG